MQPGAYHCHWQALRRDRVDREGLLSFEQFAPIFVTVNNKLTLKQPVRCGYVKDCYLAEALQCYGYMVDCPLYMRTNDEPCNEVRFHAAMDRLITSTKAKHERLAAAKAKIQSVA